MTAKEKTTEKWLKTGLLDDMPTPESQANLAVILNNVAGAWFQSVEPWFDTEFVLPVVAKTIQNLVETLGPENVEAAELPAGLDEVTGKAYVVSTHHLPKPEHCPVTPEKEGENVRNLYTPLGCGLYADELTKEILGIRTPGSQRVVIYIISLQQNYQYVRMCCL